MAFQPIDFHRLSSAWVSQTWSSVVRMLMVASKPRSWISELIRPDEPKMLDASENMMTQLMKWGRVVTVCTTFWNRLLLISLRKMANSMGTGIRM